MSLPIAILGANLMLLNVVVLVAVVMVSPEKVSEVTPSRRTLVAHLLCVDRKIPTYDAVLVKFSITISRPGKAIAFTCNSERISSWLGKKIDHILAERESKGREPLVRMILQTLIQTFPCAW